MLPARLSQDLKIHGYLYHPWEKKNFPDINTHTYTCKQTHTQYHHLAFSCKCFPFLDEIISTAPSSRMCPAINNKIYFFAYLNNFQSSKSNASGRRVSKSIILKKQLYDPFLWMGFNCLKARDTSRRQYTFYH